MSELPRREFLSAAGRIGLISALSGLGRKAWGDGPAVTAASPASGLLPAYLDPLAKGRRFASLSEARAAGPEPGDVILVRDLGQLAPPNVWTTERTRGKWQLQPHRLADGQSGRLLAVDDWAKDEARAAVPPELEIKLDLPGWYALWLGVPRVDRHPRAAGLGGVDAALDTDPAFVHVQPERGTRRGKFMGPMGVEVFCYWKCAPLDGRTLRLRVPYGTFASQPWGMVRGSLSALRLVRLHEAQVRAYQQELSDPATKRVIVVCDGFSHYWAFSEPGNGIDARLVQAYRQSDVKMLFLQSPATGVASWPSRVTSLLGDGASDEDWKALRRGDRRAADYVRWACRNGHEGMKVVSQLCRQAGLEFHASLRMNLFWGDDPFGRAINGRFWREHPELRKRGSSQLDYALPGARQFVVRLLTELAVNYDPAGVNLDFTRWPPIADPSRHDFSVLTGLMKEVRQALDNIGQQKKRKIALSANVVDGFHAGCSLAQQKIDLEAWLATGALDFVCVEACDHGPYLALAKRYQTPYYPHQDNEPPRGQTNDPEWKADHDPLPGEEYQEAPHLNNTLDPTEWDAAALAFYRQGADGICIVNNFMGWRSTGRLGHVEELAGRVAAGQVWGQQVGPAIQIEKT